MLIWKGLVWFIVFKTVELMRREGKGVWVSSRDILPAKAPGVDDKANCRFHLHFQNEHFA